MRPDVHVKPLPIISGQAVPTGRCTWLRSGNRLQTLKIQSAMRAIRRSVRFGHKLGRLDTQRFGNLAEDSKGSRHLGALDGTDMACAQARAVRQFLLRQFLAMTYATQIDRHDLVEIHDVSGT